MERLREIYFYTHILPSELDFYTQVNNHDPVYLLLYWFNLERLYPTFVQEEMDLEAIFLMRDADYAFFQIPLHALTL